MEDYYNRMTQCFNDLANGGAQYAMNDHQKIQAFSQGLKNATAVRYHVDAKQAWDAIQGPKDFDTYYNLFSSKLQQYCTLMGDGTHTDNRQINNVDTGGRGRGRGGRFGRGGGRGRGRGRGRDGGSYHNNNPYHNPPGLPNFTAEARN
ncbi:predicted protein [Chaetoceros tenuissimus]|uniref:Uncharacterized protein n=1 Tax=Chaetoceros tenuissimus TaxID=426638 RepID=A0AAD3H4Z3_9STRA|nr:predicted protein [Chaetoceros tenuissimus]